jgi:hypothetical protein
MFFILSIALQLAVQNDLNLTNEIRGHVVDPFPSSIFDPSLGFEGIQIPFIHLEKEKLAVISSRHQSAFSVDSDKPQTKEIAEIYVSGPQAQDLLVRVLKKAIRMGGVIIFVSDMKREGEWIELDYIIIEVTNVRYSFAPLLSSPTANIRYKIMAMRDLAIKSEQLRELIDES